MERPDMYKVSKTLRKVFMTLVLQLRKLRYRER